VTLLQREVRLIGRLSEPDWRNRFEQAHERVVAKPPNDPNQAADRASCGAISGDIGSAGGGTGLFPSTPSLDQNEH
jgi:hypothetical protein